MIWKHVQNDMPTVDCKCEALVKRKDGDLQLFFCEFDPMLGVFLINSITEEIQDQYEAVHYWRVL